MSMEWKNALSRRIKHKYGLNNISRKGVNSLLLGFVGWILFGLGLFTLVKLVEATVVWLGW